MYRELLTKVTVVEASAPKKQSAIIVTVSNMDGTMESLAVKQVDGRLESVIKAAIAEAQAALIGTPVDESVASTENDAVEVTVPEVVEETETKINADSENIGENNEASEVAEEVDDFPADEESEEMAIPDSEAEMNALLADFSDTVVGAAKAVIEATDAEPVAESAAVNEADAETAIPAPVISEEPVEDVPVATGEKETSEIPSDTVTEETVTPVTESAPEASDEPEDFMVTMGVHTSSPMMASECAALLAKNNQQERKMLRQAATTVAYAKGRGGNPDVIKQASDYLAYMEAKGLYQKED